MGSTPILGTNKSLNNLMKKSTIIKILKTAKVVTLINNTATYRITDIKFNAYNNRDVIKALFKYKSRDYKNRYSNCCGSGAFLISEIIKVRKAIRY